MHNRPSFASRLMRVLLGMALLPLCAALSLAFLDLLRLAAGTGALLSPQSLALFTGHAVWLLVWFFLPPPLRTYVLAHELSHALGALLCGGKARDLRVTARGGSVRVSKSNLLISLAPYFVPFYTLLLLLLRFLLGLFVAPIPWPLVWIFLVGFTWSFHITFTIQSLLVPQPDIQESGRLLSYAMIYLVNIGGICLWIVCTTAARAADLAAAVAGRSVAVYAALLAQLGRLAGF